MSEDREQGERKFREIGRRERDIYRGKERKWREQRWGERGWGEKKWTKREKVKREHVRREKVTREGEERENEERKKECGGSYYWGSSMLLRVHGVIDNS